MTQLKNLIKLKTFLAQERQTMAELTPPADFAAQLQKLAADYDLRQAAVKPEPRPGLQPAPKPIPRPRRYPQLHLAKRRSLPSPLLASVVLAALIVCAIAAALPDGSSLPRYFSGLVEIKAAQAASGAIDGSQGFIISASQPISGELVEKSLHISPAFEYKLEAQDESTYHVLPLEPLAENTIYHLSFDPERVQDEQPVRAEYSWSFQTETVLEPPAEEPGEELPQKFSFEVSQSALASSFGLREIPYWPLVVQGEDDGSLYMIQIFVLAQAEDYGAAWARLQLGEDELLPIPEQPLYQYYELAALPIDKLSEEPSSPEPELKLSLPETLPPGYYQVVISKQGHEKQLLLQISGLKAYMVQKGLQQLLWLHDEQGIPLMEARISLWPQGLEQGQTDDNGLALLPAPPDNAVAIYCLQTEEYSLVLDAATAAPALDLPGQESYYLYTDQHYYQPGQTINYFGLYQPSSALEEQQLSLVLCALEEGERRPLPYRTQLTEEIFCGQLSLPGLINGPYELALYMGEDYVGGHVIEVGPAQPYELSIRPVSGQDGDDDLVEWLIEASYQGMPLAGLQVEVQDISGNIKEELLTDREGQGRLKVAAGELQATANLPNQQNLHAYGQLELPIEAEYADLLAEGSSLFVLAGEDILAAIAGTEHEGQLLAEDYPAAYYGWQVHFAAGIYNEKKPLLLKEQQEPAAQLEAIWQEDGFLQQGSIELELKDSSGQGLAAQLHLHVLDASTQTTLLFSLLSTDEEGRGELQLPAQAEGPLLLRWHVYMPQQNILAEGAQELAGYPFSPLKVHWAEGLQEGDAPVLRINAQGPQLPLGQDIVFELDSDLPLTGWPLRFKAQAGQGYELQLPPLAEGNYQFGLTGHSMGWQEQYQLNLNVQSGWDMGYQFRSRILQPDLRLDFMAQLPADEEITLMFSSPQQALVAQRLFEVSRSETPRLDHQLAAEFAAGLLQQHFGWADEAALLPQLGLYQRQDGGLAALPQSVSNRELSALAAPLVGGGVDRNALAAYLYQCYQQAGPEYRDIEQARALYGLAALDQPVLLEIGELLNEDISLQARIYGALAYVACGNGAAAKELTQELMEVYLPQLEAVSSDITAHLALLAHVFDLPQAEALYAALGAVESFGIAQVLAEVQILAALCYDLPPNAYFSYHLWGHTEQIRLREYGQYSLALSVEQLAQLSFGEVAGEIAISIISRQQPQFTPQYTLGQRGRPALLKRSYQQQEEEIVLAQGELIEVRLDIFLPQEAPAGYYRLEDILPAGLSFVGLDKYASSRRAWLVAEQENRLSFSIYKGQGEYYGSLVYTAWAELPGLYHAGATRLYGVKQPQIMRQGLPQVVLIE